MADRTKAEQQPQAEEKALTGSGVMQAVEAVSTVASGVGGVAGAAYVVKHWNDPPANVPQASAAPPPASPTAEPSEPRGPTGQHG